MAEQPALVGALADFRARGGQLDADVAHVRRRRNQQVHLALLGRRFESLDLVKCLEPVARLRGARLDAGADPFQFLAQEPLPPPLRLFGDLLAHRLGLEIGRVVPRMRVATPVGQLDDARGDHIEEIAVVGHEDHRAGELAQEFLEPPDGLGIEMVRRLIQAAADRAARPARGRAPRGASRRPKAVRPSRPAAVPTRRSRST